MTIIANTYQHVIGVDTHARKHAFALINTTTGAIVKKASFPTTAAGLTRAATWCHTHGGSSFVVAVEGSGFYGANLTRVLQRVGITVYEASPPPRADRARRGKSDTADAAAAARSILGLSPHQIPTPRADGIRAAIAVRSTARAQMAAESRTAKLQLTALARGHDLGIDARAPLTEAQVNQIATWRARRSDAIAVAAARAEAVRLARRLQLLRDELALNDTHLTALVDQAAPGLLAVFGVGPVTAATLITVYSHPGRFHSEAAFARCAGVAPLPASSGNVVRHRLCRTGNRALNAALWRIARTRMDHDPDTRAYVTQRRAQGRSDKEILRCLKRYIARSIYRLLGQIMA